MPAKNKKSAKKASGSSTWLSSFCAENDLPDGLLKVLNEYDITCEDIVVGLIEYDIAWLTERDIALLTERDIVWLTERDIAWLTELDIAWPAERDIAWYQLGLTFVESGRVFVCSVIKLHIYVILRGN